MNPRWPLSTLLLALASPAFAAELKGQIRYGGTATVAPQPVTRDNKVCGQSQPDESLLVGPQKGLKNAVVFLKDPPKGAPPRPAAEVLLDQVGCRYAPHVLAARVGDRLVAVNSDSVLHNVRGTAADGKTPFNVAMPLSGMRRAFELKAPGLIRTGCDAGHTWMSAYVQVFDHPFFAVSGEDGRFALPDVPPGKYTLVVWHERLGEKTQSVSVGAKGAVAQIELK